LPQLGAIGVVDGIKCEQPVEFTQDDGSRLWEMACALYVPLGRELTVKASIPTCMAKVVRARVQSRDWTAELMPMTQGGSTVIFENSRFGQPTPGKIKMDKVNLIIKSSFDASVPCR
jgi:hypothetical protein